jgi:hypothetical protein
MSLLEVLQLIGYSLGAMLPIWMGYLLFQSSACADSTAVAGLLVHGAGMRKSDRHIAQSFRSDWALGKWRRELANTVAVISITVVIRWCFMCTFILGQRARPLITLSACEPGSHTFRVCFFWWSYRGFGPAPTSR